MPTEPIHLTWPWESDQPNTFEFPPRPSIEPIWVSRPDIVYTGDPPQNTIWPPPATARPSDLLPPIISEDIRYGPIRPIQLEEKIQELEHQLADLQAEFSRAQRVVGELTARLALRLNAPCRKDAEDCSGEFGWTINGKWFCAEHWSVVFKDEVAFLTPAEADELKKDKARLDWLETKDKFVFQRDGENKRDAIDRNMSMAVRNPMSRFEALINQIAQAQRLSPIADWLARDNPERTREYTAMQVRESEEARIRGVASDALIIDAVMEDTIRTAVASLVSSS